MNSKYEFIVATSAIFIGGAELEKVMGHFYRMESSLLWVRREARTILLGTMTLSFPLSPLRTIIKFLPGAPAGISAILARPPRRQAR